MENGRANSSTRHPGARPRLFISYRRRFDLASARLLKDGLTRDFGEGTVFRDVDDIKPGKAFPNTIHAALESCDVFLLLVSPGWVELIEELRDPEDFVRREVAAALARGIPLVPVLLGDARMPEADELPEEIRDLAFRQAIKLSDEHWDDDVERLVKLIRELVPFTSFLRTRLGKTAVVAAVLALFVCAGLAVRYELYGGDFEGCVRRYTPGSLGGVGRVETGAYDAPVVRADEYHYVLEHRHDPAGIPLLVRLTDSGHEVGAVFLRYFRGDDINNSLFKVERVIEPRCADVQEYLNDAAHAADKHALTNWQTLRVRLGGRDYFLRVGDHGESILATLTLTGRN
ncbi:MAG: toll/interleukin-1 receptor domain-containing protein [Pyrinomonadaceae bacterium]